MEPQELARYVEARVDEAEHAAEQAMPAGTLTRTPHEVFDECRGLRALLAWRDRQWAAWRRSSHAADEGRALAADEALAVYAREAYRNRDDWPSGPAPKQEDEPMPITLDTVPVEHIDWSMTFADARIPRRLFFRDALTGDEVEVSGGSGRFVVPHAGTWEFRVEYGPEA